jgi:hypothetical protein
MALQREVVGALSHAELVELVLQLDARLEQALALIAEQQAHIAHLEARIRDLEQRDRNDPSKRMPGLKPAATPRRKSGPRKRRAHGFSRRECPTPTEQVVHAAAVCPRCATPLSGGTERWRKEVLDLPAAAVRIIQHLYLERRCPTCRQRVVPPPASPAELGC